MSPVAQTQVVKAALGGNISRVSVLVSVIYGLGILSPWTAGAQGPPDQPMMLDSAGLACMRRAMQPLTARAQATLPEAIRRFKAGLGPNHFFSVTVRLYDRAGREENVFVVIQGLRGDTLTGYLDSEIGVVSGFQRGMRMLVLPGAALDWTIVRPDGTEEGNLIGNWIDSLHMQLAQRPGTHVCALLPPN